MASLGPWVDEIRFFLISIGKGRPPLAILIIFSLYFHSFPDMTALNLITVSKTFVGRIEIFS